MGETAEHTDDQGRRWRQDAVRDGTRGRLTLTQVGGPPLTPAQADAVLTDVVSEAVSLGMDITGWGRDGNSLYVEGESGVPRAD